MTAWASEELARIGKAEELDIAARRRDGTLRNPVTIWVVPYDDGLYVRSVNGRNGAWFRGTQATHQGRIWAGGVEKDVSIADVDQDIDDELDAVYRDKYRRYSWRIVNTILTPEARSTTTKLVPR